MQYPWFIKGKSSQPLEQGMIIHDFEWFDYANMDRLRNDDGSAVEFPSIKNHVIILSQSCDLQKPGFKYVHICPVYTLDDYFVALGLSSQNQRQSKFDDLNKNRIAAMHLTDIYNLRISSPLKDSHLVIDFGQTTVVPMSYLSAFIKAGAADIPILSSPYREALSQRYGNFFSRIGNPVNISPLTSA